MRRLQQSIDRIEEGARDRVANNHREALDLIVPLPRMVVGPLDTKRQKLFAEEQRRQPPMLKVIEDKQRRAKLERLVAKGVDIGDGLQVLVKVARVRSDAQKREGEIVRRMALEGDADDGRRDGRQKLLD